jgi:ankyrin repeat protein
VKSDLGEAGYQLTTADWFRASRGNDTAALKKFIAGGFAAATPDETGDSALHAAAYAGARDSADFLMDRGLSVDLRGALDRTPLMAAVMGNQTAMVRWLLRQGADPRAKDKEGFVPLMLAVREGKSGAVEELAPYNRENLDPAILLAALVGQTEVIDTLTNYGASVYARMEDGRTPLMIAAENGHAESVKLLLDIGAGRLSTDAAGHTAADLAITAGHPEIAALITRDPLPAELVLESPAEIAISMDAFVDAAAPVSPDRENPEPDSTSASLANQKPSPSIPIQGEVLSATVAVDTPSAANPPPPTSAANTTLRLPPLIMRHYREREVPLQVRSVEGETAILAINGASPREVKVRPGETVPGSRLVVLRVQRRTEDSKVSLGKPLEVSVVEVRDTATGTTREWLAGVPSGAHDPVALIEDAATGRRYTASPGQRFKTADGAELIVSDVRPNQLVIEDAATGAVQTIPLRGPRG